MVLLSKVKTIRWRNIMFRYLKDEELDGNVVGGFGGTLGTKEGIEVKDEGFGHVLNIGPAPINPFVPGIALHNALVIS